MAGRNKGYNEFGLAVSTASDENGVIRNAYDGAGVVTPQPVVPVAYRRVPAPPRLLASLNIDVGPQDTKRTFSNNGDFDRSLVDKISDALLDAIDGLLRDSARRFE